MNACLNYKSATIERIDVSERRDINRSNRLKECRICHYWYFKNIGYKFEPCLYNKCHDISMMTFELENIAMLNVKVLNMDAFYGI